MPNTQTTDCNSARSYVNTGDHTTILGNGAECSNGNPYTTVCQPDGTIVVPWCLLFWFVIVLIPF